MARVLVREFFTDENMAEVTIAICAADFGTTTVSIWNFLHSSSNFLVKAWPAAAGMKLGV